MKFSRFLPIATLVLMFSTTCQSEYERAVKKGLSSGERHNELFLGMHLGMSSKDFFTYCWQLNKQQLIYQGNSNTSVLYETKEMRYPAYINFYPQFHNDTIFEMPLLIHYKAWAPWNKHLWADSLLIDVKRLLEKWHGPGFFEMHHPKKGSRWVKIDGNRRIILWKEDDQYVKVLYTDLTKEANLDAEKEAQQALKNRSS